MPRPVLLLVLTLSLSCLLSVPARAADPALPGTRWLERLLESFVQRIPPLDAQLAKQEEMLRKNQDLVARAVAAGDAQSAGLARNAVAHVQAARDKTQASRRHEEANIAKVQAMLDSLRAGTAGPKLTECVGLAVQVERDTAQAARHKEETDKANAAREQWADSTKEAQKEARDHCYSLLLAGIGEYLGQFERSASAYKGWITRYRNKLLAKGVNVDLLLSKIDVEKVKYLLAKFRVDITRLATSLDEIAAQVTALRDALQVLIRELGRTSEGIRQTLEIPAVKDILNEESPDVDLATFVVGDMVGKRVLKAAGLKALPVDVASFVANYGYDATKWYQGKQRVDQYNAIADQQLAAANAMQKRIAEDMERFAACKQDLLAEEGLAAP